MHRTIAIICSITSSPRRILLIPPFFFFFFNDTPTPEISTLPLHDALPISLVPRPGRDGRRVRAPSPAPARLDDVRDVATAARAWALPGIRRHRARERLRGDARRHGRPRRADRQVAADRSGRRLGEGKRKTGNGKRNRGG